MDPDSTFNLLSAAANTSVQSDQGNVWLRLLLLVVLIACNAFFAASEIAIISLNDNKLKQDAKQGNKKAKRLVKLTGNPSAFLATIQVGVTLSGFLASAVAATSFAKMITNALSPSFPQYRSLISGVSTVVITIILSFVTLVFGELVPKRIAMKKYEKISYSVSGVLSFIKAVTKPFIILLTAATNGIVRLLGFDPNENKEIVTEEEIMMMVDAGEEEGVIEESEREMISNIFEFDDTTVEEIMTHRTEIVGVEDTGTIADAVRISMEEGYSRIPVYREDMDNILGIIYVKDLLRFIGRKIPDNVSLTSFMHKPYYIPEAKKCSELFDEMTARKVHIAVIVDEYGGTSGIITMEDLLESIVGNIQDEFDDEEEEMVQVDDTTFTVDGATNIDEVCDLLEINLPEGDYDSIGGFILDKIKRIPSPDEHPVVEYAGATFTVTEVDERRIAKIKIVRPQPKRDDGNDDGE
ncbi:MAG: HlyC/CorC family transporter [Clostridia bacterium]|nr:HlyC/CorC family transporter [Clostridia bacterium]